MDNFTDILFLAGRILYGGFFVVSGLSYLKHSNRLTMLARSKRVPYARAAVFASAALSVLGGLGVTLGRYTDLSLAAIIIVLAAASYKLHDYWNMSDPDQITVEMAQFMRNMALIGASLMIYSVLLPWSYSF